MSGIYFIRPAIWKVWLFAGIPLDATTSRHSIAWHQRYKNLINFRRIFCMEDTPSGWTLGVISLLFHDSRNLCNHCWSKNMQKSLTMAVKRMFQRWVVIFTQRRFGVLKIQCFHRCKKRGEGRNARIDDSNNLFLHFPLQIKLAVSIFSIQMQ